MQYVANASVPTATLDFALSLVENDCPGGCSGSGTCDKATHKCTCNEGFHLEDCSEDSTALTPSFYDAQGALVSQGIVHTQTIKGGKYAFYKLDTSKLSGAGQLSINVTAINPMNVWCKTVPQIAVQRTMPGIVVPEQQGGCKWTDRSPAFSEMLTVCGSKFQVHPGDEWWVSVYANGYADMAFTVNAEVFASQAAAQVEALTEKIRSLDTKIVTLQRENAICQHSHTDTGGLGGGAVFLLVTAFSIVAGGGASCWASGTG